MVLYCAVQCCIDCAALFISRSQNQNILLRRNSTARCTPRGEAEEKREEYGGYQCDKENPWHRHRRAGEERLDQGPGQGRGDELWRSRGNEITLTHDLGWKEHCNRTGQSCMGMHIKFRELTRWLKSNSMETIYTGSIRAIATYLRQGTGTRRYLPRETPEATV